MSDPLDELFVDEVKVDTTVVAEILKGKFIFSHAGEIEFLPEFENFSEMKQVLAYLVARKALFLRGLVELEGVLPKQIDEVLRLKPGNAAKQAYELKNYVKKDKEGLYQVLNHKLLKVRDLLSGKEK
ncbi:MAG: hypothetical protein GOV15_04215, partial [Candidatus Diapherotrites archaeon]|nr:hypothetical protein [Candidatus Diapherotrites archaeon]